MKHTKKAASLGVQDIQNACGNPYGMDVVDVEAIDTYRWKSMQEYAKNRSKQQDTA
jgi:hypothetical protein